MIIINTIASILYIFFIIYAWTFLDKNNIVDKYQNKNNKKFRGLISFAGIISLIFTLTLFYFDCFYNSSNIAIVYLEWILVVPFLLWIAIKSVASERNKIKYREKKSWECRIKFCYACGTELRENKVCPNCGEKIIN